MDNLLYFKSQFSELSSDTSDEFWNYLKKDGKEMENNGRHFNIFKASFTRRVSHRIEEFPSKTETSCSRKELIKNESVESLHFDGKQKDDGKDGADAKCEEEVCSKPVKGAEGKTGALETEAKAPALEEKSNTIDNKSAAQEEKSQTPADSKSTGQPGKGTVCECQNPNPEGGKRPPCDCTPVAARKPRDERTRRTCPDCEQIKLNANMIRALQRITELQAKQKLTELDVKQILEEEYQGNVFGYRAKPAKEQTDNFKADEKEMALAINQREQEMRKEFKDLIEKEIAKLDDKEQVGTQYAPPKKAQNQKEEESKEKKEKIKKKKKKKKGVKEMPMDVQEVVRWMYPGHHIGHRTCLDPVQLVPKNMGWLWNSSKGAGKLKPGRGWCPGAIRKDVLEIIKVHRQSRKGGAGGSDDEEVTVMRSSQRSGTSRSKETIKSQPEKYNPTLHIHKKQGYYYFSLYPVKTNSLEKIGKEPKPTMFKVNTKHSGSEGEGSSTSSDDSYEIEFVTPTAMRKQIKKPLKKHNSQQYDEEDFSPKSNKRK